MNVLAPFLEHVLVLFVENNYVCAGLRAYARGCLIDGVPLRCEARKIPCAGIVRDGRSDTKKERTNPERQPQSAQPTRHSHELLRGIRSKYPAFEGAAREGALGHNRAPAYRVSRNSPFAGAHGVFCA